MQVGGDMSPSPSALPCLEEVVAASALGSVVCSSRLLLSARSPPAGDHDWTATAT